MPVFSKTLGNLSYNDPNTIRAIANHLRVLQEELEYRLAHLDSANVQELSLDETNVFSSRGGLLQLLNETDESIAKLSVRDDEISTSVQDLRRDTESAIQQTAEKIELSVQKSIEYTNGKLENYSTIQQTADAIELGVKGVKEDLDGVKETVSHSLKLDAGGVYIVDNKGNTVTISGGQIGANSIYTNALHLGGDMAVHSTALGNEVGGYIGYSASLNDGTTGGMHIASADGRSDIAVTGNGARMLYRGNFCAVTADSVLFSADGRAYAADGSAFYPDVSPGGSVTCGNPLNKWTDVYSENSAINTSDRNQKTDISYEVDSRYDELWQLLRPCTGKFVAGSSGRTHMFLIAQDVEEAMEKVGLTGAEFAGLVKSPDAVNGGYIYGLRYGEFIPLCIRHIRKLEDEVAALSARVAALES